MLISNTERQMLRLNLQFFGEGAEGGAEGAEGAGNGAGDNGGNGAGQENNNLTQEAIEKLVQSRVDKITADLGKKLAASQKEVEKLKKDAMSAEEVKKYEDEQRSKDLADREKAITEKENRYYALNAVLKANIGVDSDVANDVVDLVMGADNGEIDGKIATLTKIVNKLSANKVDGVFKQNGRDPKGSGGGEGGKKENTIAEKLGQRAADANKQANDILNHYIGGKK